MKFQIYLGANGNYLIMFIKRNFTLFIVNMKIGNRFIGQSETPNKRKSSGKSTASGSESKGFSKLMVLLMK